MKKNSKPRLANKTLVSLCKLFYANKYFSKKVNLIEDGSLAKIKPPYVLIANHASFADVGALVTMLPHRHPANFIASQTQFSKYGNVLKSVGVISKKQFTVDPKLIRDIQYVLQKKRVVVIYPEAKLSVVGTPNTVKPSIAKLIKLLKVPLVTVNFAGNYLHKPRWTDEKRFCPLVATVKQTVRPEEVGTLSVDEIYRRIIADIDCDDYAYQLQNKIQITSPRLVEGLETVLYKCPECGNEFCMTAQGHKLKCSTCGAEISMNDYGQLVGGRFDKVVEYYRWQEKSVRDEIESGSYHVCERCRAEKMVKNKFVDDGMADFVHDGEGNIVVAYDDGRRLEFAKGTFYTLSFNNKYVFLPTDTVNRFSFGKVGLTTKLNIAVEQFDKRS